MPREKLKLKHYLVKEERGSPQILLRKSSNSWLGFFCLYKMHCYLGCGWSAGKCFLGK